MKVLVSEPLSPVGLALFQETPGIDVDVKTGLTAQALKTIIGDYEGLIIRSATHVGEDILASAGKLRIIGRAGVGLDNVDIAEASRRGIVVMNTPEGNTITAAEHTIAMMMAISRNIPQATASLKQGEWKKKAFKGRELFNKTLGLIGAGHIGRIVADRARGMKMKVIVFDPYIRPETIEKLDLEPVSLEELLARSDYITIHTPKTEETTGMINRETLNKMKKDAILLNCARGGIVNEEDLFEALESRRLAGAAFDVFTTEPPGKSRLMALDNFICTPHLGASTREAQDNVAKEIVEQIIAYLLHGSVKNAVNVPSISTELMSVLRPYVVLLERMGALQGQLSDSALVEVRIDYSGIITQYDVKPLTTAMLKGLLTPILKHDVNFVNAPYIAANRGIKVVESKTRTHDDFASLLKLTVKTLEDEHVVSGTIFGKKFPRIVRINNFHLEAIPEGHNLLIHNENVPGVIGAIASTLGQNRININRMQVGEEREHRENVIFLSVNEMVNDDVVTKIKDLKHIISVRRINL